MWTLAVTNDVMFLYRYWEAVKHWDEALQLTPTSAVLHEMKSQVSLYFYLIACIYVGVCACMHVRVSLHVCVCVCVCVCVRACV